MIRRAVLEDLPELLDIYNYEIVNGVATFDEIPQTYEQRKVWFDEHQGNYSLLVKEVEGRVVGYASVSKFFAKSAYDISGEVSVYVAKEFQGQGIGKELLSILLEKIREEGNFESLFSLITRGNDASIHIHEEAGFEYAGMLSNAGVKFGKHLDVMIYQYAVKQVRKERMKNDFI